MLHQALSYLLIAESFDAIALTEFLTIDYHKWDLKIPKEK